MSLQQAVPHAHSQAEPFLVLLIVVGIYFVIHFAMSRLSGWNRLAQRFAATGAWSGESWSWQTAIFRNWIQYKHCMIFGADTQSLSISMVRIFGFFHPPMRIPWSEIEVKTEKKFFGLIKTAEFVLGRQERVRVRIYGKLVARLREAAGPGWPLFHQEQAPMVMAVQVGK